MNTFKLINTDKIREKEKVNTLQGLIFLKENTILGLKAITIQMVRSSNCRSKISISLL